MAERLERVKNIKDLLSRPDRLLTFKHPIWRLAVTGHKMISLFMIAVSMSVFRFYTQRPVPFPALSGFAGLFTFAFGAPSPAYMFFGRFRLMETAAPGHDVFSFVTGKR